VPLGGAGAATAEAGGATLGAGGSAAAAVASPATMSESRRNERMMSDSFDRAMQLDICGFYRIDLASKAIDLASKASDADSITTTSMLR
jgi:hypothetical protein